MSVAVSKISLQIRTACDPCYKCTNWGCLAIWVNSFIMESKWGSVTPDTLRQSQTIPSKVVGLEAA